MLNVILLIVLFLIDILTLLCLKFINSRKIGAIISLSGVVICFIHYCFVILPNAKFIETLNSLNITEKLKLYEKGKLNDASKKLLVYSIADNVENLTNENLRTILIDKNNFQITRLFFNELQIRGLIFTDKQFDYLVENIIKDKNLEYKQLIAPSISVYKAVLRRINHLVENFTLGNEYLELKSIAEIFPDLFNKKELYLIEVICNARAKELKVINENYENNIKLDKLNKQKTELEKQAMKFPMNWTLRGRVEDVIENNADNRIIISSANLEGTQIGNCILRTNKQLNNGDFVAIIVKEDGEDIVELQNSRKTIMKVFSEDNSSEKRDKINKQIIELHEKIIKLKKITVMSDEEKVGFEINKLLVIENMKTLRKIISMKERKYEL